MSTDTTFITNEGNKKLKDRIAELIAHSKELKFLVGFFYFSGIRELYTSLKNNPNIQLDVLVGLNVDKTVHGLTEYGDTTKGLTDKEKFELFLGSISKSINSDDFDNQVFYDQARFFIEAIKQDKLRIRKTYDPNHAKLYIFKLKDELATIKKAFFITGSSNLTKAGLSHQNEFNVEISDYGAKDAEEYFDKLWEEAVKVTEIISFKDRLIDLLEKKTLLTEVTPYEAFALVLKTYIELQEQKQIKQSLIDLLKKKGYRAYKYQTDAVAQAISILDQYKGVIVADVVGLGKSIIAGLIAKSLGKRGIILCPPGLIGDDNAASGWRKYREDFALHDWEIRSSGLENLKKALDLVRSNPEYEVVIIDEVHRFRNQDTEAYEVLSNICRDKLVIMLTATPFNNTPADILSLLKLFIVPGKSNITLANDLTARFRSYTQTFRRLSNIRKNCNSPSLPKRNQAIADYEVMFGANKIDLNNVRDRTRYLSKSIRNVISQVTIRRNRIDLRKDPEYSKEIYELSDVQDPCEIFYELTPEQSEFYDRVLQDYFGERGQFTGAIYQPFLYETGQLEPDEETLNQAENRESLIQRNLYDFMRRLLVKRFESSFGSFRQSIINFKSVTEKVQAFIDNSNGKYILDRPLLERIYEADIDEIEEELAGFEQRISEGAFPKTEKVYKVNEFISKDKFITDIQSDIDLFDRILDELDSLKLVNKDPKLKKLATEVKNILNKKDKPEEPERKIVIFTEYIDTARYLEAHLEKEFPSCCITVKGDLNKTKSDEVLRNFDTTHKKPEDSYKILITTDKMSEGFNLNRAGAVINYDIPWNPTRVIQRVGRINRISKRVFKNLYIYNFFPTLQGATYVKSREIATEKMFLIHNTLGEDAKIFEPDEEPSASQLFKRIMENPDNMEEESFQTKIRQLYADIVASSPEVIKRISELPPRIKVAKNFNENNLVVFIKKGLGLFTRGILSDDKKPQDLVFENTLELIECKKEEKAILAIPIYKPSNEEQGPIIEQVNQILSIVRDNGYPDNPAEFPEIMELEKQIDQMVYKLYGLTEEEKMVVEGKPQDD
ncbi:helicase-related protein [Dehalococcoides mccartyi]|uniref:helicase-related protein n=3 Tax=Dehalococcoides mccartyi TaxID=61435 RepID=UPI00241F7692|nr:helicase-related protein [Dehalococcoides mccartyi]